MDFGRGEAFHFDDVVKNAYGVRAAVAEDVFLPGDVTTVGAEKLGSVGREMRETEFVIGHDEMARGEFLVVRLSFSFNVSRTPTAVDQFPFAVVNLYRVPGVV